MSALHRLTFALPGSEPLVASVWCAGRSTKPAPAPAANDDGAPAVATPKRVLIVEDEVVIGMTLEVLVEDMGFEPCGMATSGREAVEKAATLRPDIVLMDVNLGPGIDGVEAARIIRETVGPRIVFVTAYGSGEIMERIRAAAPGAPVVPKPATAAALKRAIGATEI